MKKKGSLFLVLILLMNTILQGVSGASLAFAQEQTSPSSALVSNSAETAKKEDSESTNSEKQESSSSETQKSTVNKAQGPPSSSSSQESSNSTSQTTSAATTSEDDDDALPPGPPPTPTAISGAPKITITPNSQSAYRTGEAITSYVNIDGSTIGSSTPLEGAYLDIEIPTALYPGGKVLETNAYIEDIAIGELKSGNAADPGLVKTTELIKKKDKTIFRVYFNAISSTAQISMPYVFRFTKGLVPRDYKLQPKVTMKDNNGNILGTATDKEYTPTYPDMNLRKVVGVSDQDGQLLYGGTAKTGDPTRISETGAEPVAFNFTYTVQPNSGQQRMMQKVVIKDKLPTYTNSNGQTVTAKFDQSLNPDWTDNGDGTVTYTKTFSESEFDTDFRHNIDVSKATLYLSFPDAKYKDGNNKPTFTNKAEITATPFNPSANEQYTTNDDITFNLIADNFDGTGILAKRTEHETVNYDVPGLYAQRLDYTVKVENKLSKPLKEIVLTEDASKFDPRLYFTSVGSFFERQGSNSKPINDKIEIRAYKSDGKFDTFTPGQQINEEAQNELNAAAEKIRNGEMTESAAPAVTPKYTKITIHFINGYELPVGKYIDGFVYMAFKDPYHVPYSPEKNIKNVVSLDAKVTNFKNQDVSINTSAEWSKRFVPFQEKIRLSKTTDQTGKTGLVGESLFFFLELQLEQLSKARYLKNPTLVDLLPKGVSIAPGVDKTKAEDMLEAIGIANLDMIDKFSVIENYNGTGRTAIKIRLKSGLVKDLNNGRGYSFKLKNFVINDEIIKSTSETPTFNNDNELYFYQDNGQPFPSAIQADSGQIVNDDKDINMNGETTDRIAKTTSKVLGNTVSSRESFKYIRSTEPLVEGGASYYGRSFTKGEIETDYSGITNNSGHFQYDLQIQNYINQPLNKVELYDVLPHVGDGRTKGAESTAFSNTLTGPVKMEMAGNDVTDQFDIYYRTDKYPTMDAATEMNSPNWTKTPSDYKDVTAIKIVSKTGTVIPQDKLLHALLDMKVPAYDKNNNIGGKIAINTFHVRYNDGTNFGESNEVTNRVNRRITIPVEKKWHDSETTHSKITAQLYATWKEDGVAKEELKEEKELSDSNHWKDSFGPHLDEEFATKYLQKKVGGKKITDFKYVVKEKVIPSGYDVDYSGDAQNGFVITNTRHPSIKIRKLWYDKDGNQIANDQLPKKLEVKLYRTTNGQTQNGELVETIQLERTATAPYLWEATKRYPPKDKTTGKYYTYYIEEVVPKYYLEISNASEKKVTFTDTNVGETATLTVKNKVNPSYPNTGGSGILPYILMGTLTLTLAVILHYMQKNRKAF
ncbi:collagen-binding protein [Streptococcus anginosus]|uniref:Cna B-type domain-containing protein n=1 Tax=Streptococcus anginosus TaxID=1328 RepID=UPI000D02BA95|nr:Cna B-type domain-containing protein [Streptococcus anginosus]PRT64064.1 collagen-binding protein [Streptococcus anginosus]